MLVSHACLKPHACPALILGVASKVQVRSKPINKARKQPQMSHEGSATELIRKLFLEGSP